MSEDVQPSFLVDAESEPAAPAAAVPARRRRRRWPVVLVCVAAVVAVALVVWIFVLPRFNPVRVGAELEHQTTRLGAPDLPTQPTWSDPIYFAVPLNANRLTITSTSVPDVVLVAWCKSEDTSLNLGLLTAVDLKTQTVLWTKNLGTYAFGSNTRDLLIISEGALTVVGPATGAVLAQTMLPPGAEWFDSAPGIIVTRQEGHLCVRSVTSLDDCLWTPSDVEYGGIFGNGRWINTGDGVRDLRTGEPAPFGADAGKDWTYYRGSSLSQVMRIAHDDEVGWTLQQWDTATDKGIGEPRVYQSFISSVNPGEFAVLQKVDASTSSVQAYSWRTGEPMWPTAHVSASAAQGIASAGLALVAPTSRATSGCLALDSITGEQLWQDAGCASMIAGSRTAYVVTEKAPQEPSTVSAHDAMLADFPQLWTVEVPKTATDIAGVAGHLFAATIDNGTMHSLVWVAKP